MKKELQHIIFWIVIGLTVIKTNAWSQEDYTLEEGLHFSVGMQGIVNTNEILFPNIRKSDPQILKTPIQQEWDKLNPSFTFELKSNHFIARNTFLGLQYNRQRLYASTSPTFLESDASSTVDYRVSFTKNVNLNTLNLFLDQQLFNYKRFSMRSRLDVGRSLYALNKSFHLTGSSAKLEKESFRSGVNNLGTGISFHFHPTSNSSFNFLAGYRFQTPSNFYRKNYIDEINGSIEDVQTDTYFDYTINYPNTQIRPIRPQHEFLYFQLSFTHRLSFDGRNFKHSWRQTGEPLYDPATVEKPILYLYPEDTTEVHVAIELFQHDFIFTYPQYPSNGWTVIASPSGNLYDPTTQRNYYSLFWETEGVPIAENLTTGFVVKGNETRTFLEEKLAQLGLNEHEANEFLIYWLPKMENNNYNAIYFAYEDYEAISQLNITPQPDCLIRIMMLFTPLEDEISLTPQTLPTPAKRKGFVAVEWGGVQGDFFTTDLLSGK